MALTPAETAFLATHEVPVVRAMKPYLDDTREAVNATIPRCTVYPVVSGTGAIGAVHSCTPGTWTNSPALTYQWRRDGMPIAGATASTYTTVTASSGTLLTCAVTGTNGTGATTVISTNAIRIATIDNVAPVPIGFSPVDNQIGVAIGVNLVVTFSETVTLGTGIVTLKKVSDNSTVTSWNVATQAGSAAGQVNVVSGTQLTLRPSVALADTTDFYVIWDANVVKDAANNPVAANASASLWNFTTVVVAGPDIVAPTATIFNPADNTTGVSVTTDLVATMSETVVLGAAGTITLKRTSDNVTIQTWNVATDAGSTAGKVNVVGNILLTMRLTTALANSIEYYVTWTAGVVQDTSANPIAANAVTTLWSFTTAAAGDVTPPTVVSFNPLDNATGVALLADLVATFSETVTLGTGVVSLKRTSDNVAIKTWDVVADAGSAAGKVEVLSGTQLTLHAGGTRVNSTEYYVIWDAGVVKDAANNPVAVQASTTLWSFTTVASGGAVTAIQWMAAPGVEVNAETTSRQWMAAPGVYGNVAPLTGAAFSGLLDLYPTATMAYSFRKLRNAYAGSAVRIRRSSDNLELNVGFLANGDFDSAAASAHIGGGSGFIVTWFDQSGNGIDVTQATVANQPAYDATWMNGKPTVSSNDGTDVLAKSVANTVLPAPTTTAMVVMNNPTPANNNLPFSWNQPVSTNTFSAYAAFSNALYFDYGNVTTGRVTVGIPSGWTTGGHLLELGREASNDQFITVDGVELVRNTGKTALPTAATVGFSVLFGSVTTVLRVSELVIWAADLAATRVAARANVATYWATPTLLLDVLGVSATRAYSTRKLRSAYAGSAIRIRRSSDNAEQDIGFVGEDLDTAAITTFVGVNSAFVVKWYDQSGTGDDFTQATVATQPRIVNAGTLDTRNGKAALRPDGVDDVMVTATGSSVQEVGMLVATSQAGPNWAGTYGVYGTATQIGFDTISGAANYDTTFGSMLVVSVNNTGTAAAVFGSVLHQIDHNRASGTTAFAAGLLLASDRNTAGRYWPGWIGELVLFTTLLSTGNRTALYTNQKTYWGTP